MSNLGYDMDCSQDYLSHENMLLIVYNEDHLYGGVGEHLMFILTTLHLL